MRWELFGSFERGKVASTETTVKRSIVTYPLGCRTNNGYWSQSTDIRTGHIRSGLSGTRGASLHYRSNSQV